MPKATDSTPLSPESSRPCEVCGKRATRKMTNNAGQPDTVWHFLCEEHGKIYWDAHCEGVVRSDKPTK